ILSPIDSYLSAHSRNTNAPFVTRLTTPGTSASLCLDSHLQVKNISVLDQSTASIAKFDYKFTISFENQLPIDLGVLGDQLGLAFPDTAKLPVDGTASFDMVFGTRPALPGTAATDPDFYFYLKSPIDLSASIHVGDADPSAAPALSTAMNV